MRKSLIAALEEEQLLLSPVQPDEVTAILIEMDDIANHLDAANKSNDNDCVAYAAIGDVAEVMYEVMADDSLSQLDANILNTAIESICQLCITLPSHTKISLESTLSSNGRIVSATFAYESLMETLRDGWKKFLDFLASVWEWTEDLYNKIFYSANTLKLRATSMLKAITDTNVTSIGNHSDKEYIENSSVFKALNVDGKIINHFAKIIGPDILGVLKESIDNVKQYVDNFDRIVGHSVSREATKIIDMVDNFIIDKRIHPVTGSLTVGDPVKYGFNINTSRMEVSRKYALPGNKSMFFITPKTTYMSESPDMCDLAKDIEVRLSNREYTNKGDGKFPVMSRTENIDMLKLVISITDILIDFEKTAIEINKVKKQFLKENSIEIMIANNPIINTTKFYKDLRNIVKYYSNTLDQPMNTLTPYCIRICKAMIKYSELSSEYKPSHI